MKQLRYMAVFAHIVESGSITGAAESLGLSKSVVSQQLKRLEQELGVTLLKRTTRQQSLTSAGESFYHHCKSLNELANTAWDEALIQQDIPQGPLRITAPHALMSTLVAPAIARVIQQYPQLKPELITSDQHLDLTQHQIDIAIRVGQTPDCRHKQRRIGAFRDRLCGHQSLVHSGIDETTPYIANHWQGRNISHVLQHKHTQDVRRFTSTATILSDSFHTCLSLIQAGAGIGLIPDFIHDQQADTIVDVFPGDQFSVNTVYALHPFNQPPKAVKRVIEEIEAMFS